MGQVVLAPIISVVAASVASFRQTAFSSLLIARASPTIPSTLVSGNSVISANASHITASGRRVPFR